MKKQILLIIFGLSTFIVNAQGNLQFNQVLTYSDSISPDALTANYTVPSGKVWKIEYAASSKINVFLIINNFSIINLPTDNNSGSLSPIFWLKANDSIKFKYNALGVTTSANYFVSIIEYNIVP